jgi:C-terminal processing protease CtpA/Prc
MNNSHVEIKALTRQELTAILAAIRKCILKRHFNVGGVDYDEWARRFDDRAPSLLTGNVDEFEQGIREALAELRSSHTVFYHERTNRLLPQHSIGATLRAFEHDGVQHWHFLDVFEEGLAQLAGIKRGDALLSVDGTQYVPPRMPSFRIDATHRLTVSDAQRERPREVEIKIPFRKGTPERPPIIEPSSPKHAIIQSRTGVISIPYFPSPTGISFANDLDLAIADLKQKGCDRLIIDLRGNIGGSLGFARLASYLCPGRIPIGHSLTPNRLRQGYSRDTLPRVPMPRSKAEFLWALARFAVRDKSVMLLTQGLGPQLFHGKVVILVNEWTNSAAEMLAGFASENRLATIVGTKTAGNVLGAVNQKLGGGYWLRVPVFGWYTSQGKCLEGQGVAPDVEADVDLRSLDEAIDQQAHRAAELLDAA